jgi:hypothetical protein
MIFSSILIKIILSSKQKKGGEVMKDMKNAIGHLKSHQTFPATRDELVKTCNELSDFSAEDKKWFEDNLPEREYKSAEEVVGALGWDTKSMKDEDSSYMHG